jgi:hypothetical protein
MTDHAQLESTPRDRLLNAAEKEVVAFERREREFRKKEQRERAAELPMPAIKDELLRSFA